MGGLGCDPGDRLEVCPLGGFEMRPGIGVLFNTPEGYGRIAGGFNHRFGVGKKIRVLKGRHMLYLLKKLNLFNMSRPFRTPDLFLRQLTGG